MGEYITFSDALRLLRTGHRIWRKAWDDTDRWLYLWTAPFARFAPCIAMHTADGTERPGWVASQSDMLADDWMSNTIMQGISIQSPDYGPAGKPSPGRVVQLHLDGQVIPASIFAVNHETGLAIVVFDDVPIFDMDPEQPSPMTNSCGRRWIRDVPFGGDIFPRWEWLPRV